MHLQEEEVFFYAIISFELVAINPIFLNLTSSDTLTRISRFVKLVTSSSKVLELILEDYVSFLGLMTNQLTDSDRRRWPRW